MAKKKFMKPRASHAIKGAPTIQGPVRDDKAILLPLSVLKADPKDNPRKDLGDLTKLAASIKIQGVLQPILVKKNEKGGLKVTAGFRRYHASKLAGLEILPCRVIDGGAEVAMIENIMRKSLNPIEHVLGVKELSKTFPSKSDLAKALGKSNSHISRCLRSAEFIKKYKFADPQISLSMLFELAEVKEPNKAIDAVKKGDVKSSKDLRLNSDRQKSGPIPGGHAVDRVIHYKESKKGKKFVLRVHFDFDQSGVGEKDRLIKQLRDILKKLEGQD